MRYLRWLAVRNLLANTNCSCRDPWDRGLQESDRHAEKTSTLPNINVNFEILIKQVLTKTKVTSSSLSEFLANNWGIKPRQQKKVKAPTFLIFAQQRTVYFLLPYLLMFVYRGSYFVNIWKCQQRRPLALPDKQRQTRSFRLNKHKHQHARSKRTYPILQETALLPRLKILGKLQNIILYLLISIDTSLSLKYFFCRYLTLNTYIFNISLITEHTKNTVNKKQTPFLSTFVNNSIHL